MNCLNNFFKATKQRPKQLAQNRIKCLTFSKILFLIKMEFVLSEIDIRHAVFSLIFSLFSFHLTSESK